jgi:putative SOS response-associated peptidase YedK
MRGRRVVPEFALSARDSGAKRKQPYAVELAGDPAMPFAGLWESWISRLTGEVIETCTIITCPANALISPLHNRMPVILPRDTIDRWLDPDTPVAELQAMLVPLSAEAMRTYPVSWRVNDPRHDAPDCIEPAPLPGSQDWWSAES